MARFLDISGWNEKPFFNTKGTRNKCVVSDPNDETLYYFKTSIKKEGKDYKPEFWSEIIASEVGISLGFNVLEYNIAKHGSEVGCISKSMTGENEYLTEGINLLTGYDNTYDPVSKESYGAYTFHFIESAIESFNFKDKLVDIIEMIVFDAIIGNSDRHQENWGFITPYKEKELSEDEANTVFSKLIRRFNKIKDFLKKDEINVTNLGKKYKVTLRILQMEGSFAPIYDSGCCLAREKSEEAINQMLNDSVMLDSFINRGKSEIRWDNDGRKLNHFDLVRKVREENKETVDNIINKVISLYSEDKIKNIVVNIDKALPDELYIEYGLSKNRKMLICKLIDERIKRLKDILI